MGLANDPTPFDGRSDYGPFIAAGIPAGGLFTGAEGIKTSAQQATYGGTTGTQYDDCYHLACDTFAGTEYGVREEGSRRDVGCGRARNPDAVSHEGRCPDDASQRGAADVRQHRRR